MKEYTDNDQKNYGDTDVSKIAYPKFQEKLQVCKDLMYGFDYSGFFGDSDLERARTIRKGANFLQNPLKEETKEDFIKESLLLKNALSLCRSLTTEKEKFESSYFESVRTILVKVTSDRKLSFKEINGRISEILQQSIKTEGVINVIEASDERSLFDPKFLDRIGSIEEDNLVIRVLEKLLMDEVKIYKKTNLVKSEEFSELMKKTMNRYINGHISNKQVIDELIDIANKIKDAHKEGEDLGLTTEELAFYNAIALPEDIHKFYTDDTLVQITHELTEALRRNRTIDWQKKESSRAEMKMIVRKLLKKYDYPPAEREGALEKVIAQCEQWADTEI